MTEDVAVPIKDTASLPSGLWKISPERSYLIGDDEPNVLKPAFLEMLEEGAPTALVLLRSFADAQNL
jgi:hypothetical protein